MKVLHQPITLYYCKSLFVLIIHAARPNKFSSILTLASLRLLYLCGASEGILISGQLAQYLVAGFFVKAFGDHRVP